MILSDGPVLRIEPTARVPQPLVQPAVASTGTDTATLSEVERDHIREVLERTAGVIEGPRGAARLLGLKPSTLRFRIRRLGIERRRAGVIRTPPKAGRIDFDMLTTVGAGDGAARFVRRCPRARGTAGQCPPLSSATNGLMSLKSMCPSPFTSPFMMSQFGYAAA